MSMDNTYDNNNYVYLTESNEVAVICEEYILSRDFINKIARNKLFTFEDFIGFNYDDSIIISPFTIKKLTIKNVQSISYEYIFNAFRTNKTITDIDIHSPVDDFDVFYAFLQIIIYNKIIKKLSINIPIYVGCFTAFLETVMIKNKTIEELNVNIVIVDASHTNLKENTENAIAKYIKRNIQINNLDKIMEQFILSINSKKLFLPEDILISVCKNCFEMLE
jgi:hypothetical protein